MADKTGIEWTDTTWNPIVGCSVVSPGCANCYAMRTAGARLDREGGPARYRGTTQLNKAGPVWTGKVHFAPDAVLTAPLRWRRPRRVFVNSMGDLFHEAVPDDWIDRVFAVMALAPQHTFQVLTKRSARMRSYITSRRRGTDAGTAVIPPESGDADLPYRVDWPLPNVWLGVSTEDQARADERVPDLLATPAAVRFVSVEPLLGPVYLTEWLHDSDCGILEHGVAGSCTCADPREVHLDWVIVGGESGPKARPMHPDWARSICNQCVAARVPFFFKQHGEFSVAYDRDVDDADWRRCDHVAKQTPRGRWLNLAGGHGFHGERVVRVVPVGKAGAGRLLDGRTWDEFPA